MIFTSYIWAPAWSVCTGATILPLTEDAETMSAALAGAMQEPCTHGEDPRR